METAQDAESVILTASAFSALSAVSRSPISAMPNPQFPFVSLASFVAFLPLRSPRSARPLRFIGRPYRLMKDG